MVNQTQVPDDSAPVQHRADDIPVAQRDGVMQATGTVRSPRRGWRLWLWGLLGLGLALGLSALTAWLWPRPMPEPSVQVSPAPEVSVPAPSPSPASPAEVGGVLGHFPYDEAPTADLKPITRGGGIQLRTAAAERFLELAEAAAVDRIPLIPLSGFRSLEDQDILFFERKAEQGQRAVERASVSAPPGYSEHHTGYAVDVGDRTQPETHLEVSFERTPTFAWMEDNAARFGFELSFPRNNPQGVSYEPWHWRFVGDRHSLETFYKARQVRPVPAPSPSPTPSPRPMG